MAKSTNAAEPLSSICLILWWLSTMNSSDTLRTREVENDGSDPPQNRGVMRPKVDARWGVPLLSAPWGRSRPHLSLREGLEKPPFPSRFIFPDRSSPSRVRFAASRPGRLRADPKDALLTRGKGGVCAVGSEGECLIH